MKWHVWTWATIVSIISAACANPSTIGKVPQGKAIRLAVHQNGQVLLNGNSVELSMLRQELEGLKNPDSVVWYYRENPEADEPPPAAMKVLETITELRLPICLSPTADFANCKGN